MAGAYYQTSSLVWSDAMNAAVVTWLVFRTLRWLSWLGFFAYSIHFLAFRESHLNPYGHLSITTEMAIFGLGFGAVFAGFLELMMRETAANLFRIARTFSARTRMPRVGPAKRREFVAAAV
jgi:hypothetical protein